MDYWEHEYMKGAAGMSEGLLSAERLEGIMQWLEGMSWWPTVKKEILRRAGYYKLAEHIREAQITQEFENPLGAFQRAVRQVGDRDA